MVMSSGSAVATSYPKGASSSKLTGVAVALVCSFGGFVFGYETGVVSGIKVMPAWLRRFGRLSDNSTEYYLPSSDDTLIVSILLVGTFLGALLAAPAADKLGRRWGMLTSTIVFVAGVAMQTAAEGVPLFTAGRFFGGLGVGGNSCIIPMYLAECSSKKFRGAFIATYQLGITVGLLLAAIVTNSTQHRPDSSAYLIPIALQFAWALVLGAGIFSLPESHRWLIKVGRRQDAGTSLAQFNGKSPISLETIAELDEITRNLEAERTQGLHSYLDCFRSTKNKMRLRTVTGILIQVFQQLTGINFVFYYGITFFKNSGIQDPFIITIVTNAVNVGMTIPGIYGIERFGRRRLLLVGCIGMCLCEYIVAVVGETISVKDLAGQQVLIVFVCLFISFFAATWGPIGWVIISELFPLELRAKAMSISTAANWLSNFVITYSIPYLVDDKPGSAGLQSKVFFIWGSTCFCGIIFTFLCVPETQGLSLEQIDYMYQAVTPVRSLEYRRNMVLENIALRPSNWEGRT